jgi:hypothetical protein
MITLVTAFLSKGYFFHAFVLAYTYILMPIRIRTHAFEVCIGKQPPALPKLPLLSGGKHS